MHERVDDGPEGPDVVLLREQRDLGPDPLVGAAALGLGLEAREAEVAEDELRLLGVPPGRGGGAAEEDVGGLEVAVDDALPVAGWRRVAAVVVAVVEEGEGARELGEAGPDEGFGDAGAAVAVQVAAAAVLEVEDEPAVALEVVGVVEVDDVGVVAGQDGLEDVHLRRDVAAHGVVLLLLAHQDPPVGFALHDPQLALAALAELADLLVRLLDDAGGASGERPVHAALPYGFLLS